MRLVVTLLLSRPLPEVRDKIGELSTRRPLLLREPAGGLLFRSARSLYPAGKRNADPLVLVHNLCRFELSVGSSVAGFPDTRNRGQDGDHREGHATERDHREFR